MSTAVVTGSTSGIGAAFADRLAARGYDLVLVARNRERLDVQAAELADRYGTQVEVISADLGDRLELSRVEERLLDADRPVSLLINNAGLGTARKFLDDDIETEQYQIDVVVVAVLRLTHAAVRAMAGRGFGGVVNISSIGSYAAGGTYSAAKAWVRIFSESIAHELHGTGVRVVAVCPGFVHTNFHAAGGMDVSSIPDWMWLSPDQVVDDAFAALRLGRDVSVPTARYRIIRAVAGHAPRRAVRALYLRGRPKR